MAEKKTTQTNTRAKKHRKKEKKPLPVPVRALVRLIAILVTCLMILGAVLFIVYRDTVSLDGVVRSFIYRDLDRDDTGEATSFTFSDDAEDAYEMVGDNLLLCSKNALQLYSVSGKLLLDQSVKMATPAAMSAGETAVAYDLGGNDLYVIRGGEVVFSYSTEQGYALLSARLNEKGYLAVVEEAAGYKASVTVYNADYDPVLRENISSAFVMDAAVSPDNEKLAVVTVGQEDTSFASYLELYECATGEKLVGLNLGSSVVLDIGWTKDLIRVQQENGLTIVNGNGEVAGVWSDSARYLQNFSINGLDYNVEMMGKYKAGSVGQLIIIGDDASEFASMAVKEEVLSVSAAGRYIAVLTSNHLLVLTKDLKEYASIPNSGATRALMRSDGSVMLIGNGEAHLYVP